MTRGLIDKESIVAKKVAAKVAAVSSKGLEAWATRGAEVMARIPAAVLSFWLKNPATQFGQNAKRDATGATIKVAGIATPYTFTYEGGYEVAVNPNSGKRGKEEVGIYFVALQSKAYANALSTLHTAASIMTWCARKIATGRSRSAEGAIMFRVLCLIEESGMTLESLRIADTTYSRDTIMAAGATRLASYERAVSAGEYVMPERLAGKSKRLASGVTL